MKGKFVVVGKSGELYYYRNFGNAVNRLIKIYGNEALYSYYKDATFGGRLFDLEDKK